MHLRTLYNCDSFVRTPPYPFSKILSWGGNYNIIIEKIGIVTMPIFSIIMLLMTLANMAVPLSCNFVREFLSLLAAFEYSLIGGGVLASLGMVLGAAYSLYLYN